MQKLTLLSLILAVALVIVCAQALMAGDSKNTENTTNMQNNSVIENMMTRTSVRNYQEKAVEKDKVVTLLKAGMAARRLPISGLGILSSSPTASCLMVLPRPIPTQPLPRKHHLPSLSVAT